MGFYIPTFQIKHFRNPIGTTKNFYTLLDIFLPWLCEFSEYMFA